MFERVETNPGQGGAPLTLDKLPNQQYVQPVKIMLAAEGQTGPTVSVGDPMPVAVAGVATAANQATANAALANIDADIGALNATAAPADGLGDYSVIGALKRALMNGAAILARLPESVGNRMPVTFDGVAQPVSGSVAVSNFPATQPVSVAALPSLAITPIVLLSAVTSTGAGAAQADAGRAPTFTGRVAGTGAVSATVAIEVRNDAAGVWIPAGTLTISGTTTAGDGFAMAARYLQYRANVTAISGTGAAVTVTMGA